MPIFRPRTRVEILRSMASRVVARSSLTRLERNGAVFHILAAAATELAEMYFQLARLRLLFSIDTATGSDLDARAAEILPSVITRQTAVAATGNVVFTRVGTTGTITIPAGTIVAAEDVDGLVRFRTAAASTIDAGVSSSALVAVVAIDRGVRGNVAAGTITKFVTRVAGVTGVANATAFTTGVDREPDDDFRARLKAFVQAMSRGTPNAIESFARNIQMSNGQRVVFAKLVEPARPNGVVELFIDDGSGGVDAFSAQYLSTPDSVLNPAVGGEVTLFTTARPIRDDGSFTLRVNGTTQTRGTDYTLNPALGQIDLTVALTAGDTVEADYRYYTGLLQHTQRVIDGDPTDRRLYPGVRPAGVLVVVRAPTTVYQTVQAALSINDGFDIEAVNANVTTAIQGYINSLNIGEHVIAAEIIERAMGVAGVTNFRILDLTGSTPPVADQIILANQVARIVAADIELV